MTPNPRRTSEGNRLHRLARCLAFWLAWLRMRRAARRARRPQPPGWVKGHDLLSDLWDDLMEACSDNPANGGDGQGPARYPTVEEQARQRGEGSA